MHAEFFISREIGNVGGHCSHVRKDDLSATLPSTASSFIAIEVTANTGAMSAVHFLLPILRSTGRGGWVGMLNNHDHTM